MAVVDTGPRNIVLDDLTTHNIKQLAKINTAVFPIHYTEKFYKDGLESSIHFQKLAYFNDIVVGGICVRFEDSSSPEVGKSNQTIKQEEVQKAALKRIYIMTLGVLTPYRRYGIGRKLLDWVVDLAKNTVGCNGIFLHVQTNNFPAKEFYEKQGFTTRGDIHKNYYTRIEPADAFLLGFDIEPLTKEEKDQRDKEARRQQLEDEKLKNAPVLDQANGSCAKSCCGSAKQPTKRSKGRRKR